MRILVHHFTKLPINGGTRFVRRTILHDLNESSLILLDNVEFVPLTNRPGFVSIRCSAPVFLLYG